MIYVKKNQRPKISLHCPFRELMSISTRVGHAFFSKEQHSCILLRSFEKNTALFVYFYVLLKRTQRSLHSFTFFCKESKRMLRSFWFHKLLKTQKKSAKERCILFKEPFPSIPPFLGKECCVLCVLLRSFEKNAMFFAFFYILLKRTQRSLRFFTFF